MPASRVELAARAGVESARAALPGPVSQEAIAPCDRRDPEVVALHLLRETLRARRVVALVPLLLSQRPETPAAAGVEPPGARGGPLDGQLAAVEAWALCPCPEHRQAPALLDRELRARRSTFEIHARVLELVECVARGAAPATSPGPEGLSADDPDLRERLRAWVLGDPLPPVDADVVRERAAARHLLEFAALFALSSEVWVPPAPPDRPSHRVPGRRVVPVLVSTGSDLSWFARRFAAEREHARTVRIPAAELVRDHLPRWAADGTWVTPVVPRATFALEVEPLALRRQLLERLTPAVAEAHRQHMEALERRRAKGRKRSPR